MKARKRFMIKCLECDTQLLASPNLYNMNTCYCWNVWLDNGTQEIKVRNWFKVAVETKKGWKVVIDNDEFKEALE